MKWEPWLVFRKLECEFCGGRLIFVCASQVFISSRDECTYLVYLCKDKRCDILIHFVNLSTLEREARLHYVLILELWYRTGLPGLEKASNRDFLSHIFIHSSIESTFLEAWWPNEIKMHLKSLHSARGLAKYLIHRNCCSILTMIQYKCSITVVEAGIISILKRPPIGNNIWGF